MGERILTKAEVSAERFGYRAPVWTIYNPGVPTASELGLELRDALPRAWSRLVMPLADWEAEYTANSDRLHLGWMDKGHEWWRAHRYWFMMFAVKLWRGWDAYKEVKGKARRGEPIWRDELAMLREAAKTPPRKKPGAQMAVSFRARR